MSARAFAISDIHGCVKTFIALVEQVIVLKKEDTLFLLGDYIDRGPDSKGVIDYIFQLKEAGFKLVTLRGNHEQMLLEGLVDEAGFNRFNVNGGDKSLLSFGVSKVNEMDKKYLDFFNTLQYFSTYENFVLVHAGLNFEVPDPLQDKFSMLWIRKFKVPTSHKDKIVVHGHVPTALTDIESSIESVHQDHQIGIDNGCFYGSNEFYGHLCCLELNSLQLFVQANIDMKPLY